MLRRFQPSSPLPLVTSMPRWPSSKRNCVHVVLKAGWWRTNSMLPSHSPKPVNTWNVRSRTIPISPWRSYKRPFYFRWTVSREANHSWALGVICSTHRGRPQSQLAVWTSSVKTETSAYGGKDITQTNVRQLPIRSKPRRWQAARQIIPRSGNSGRWTSVLQQTIGMQKQKSYQCFVRVWLPSLFNNFP